MINYDMSPDELSFLSIMQCDRDGRDNHHRIIRLYSLMTSLGVFPNKNVYDLILSALAKLSDQSEKTVQAAESILNRMIKENVTLSPKNFNSLFLLIKKTVSHKSFSHGLIDSLVEKSQLLYREMTVTYGLLPDIMTLNTLLQIHRQSSLPSATIQMDNIFQDIIQLNNNNNFKDKQKNIEKRAIFDLRILQDIKLLWISCRNHNKTQADQKITEIDYLASQLEIQ